MIVVHDPRLEKRSLDNITKIIQRQKEIKRIILMVAILIIALIIVTIQ